MITSAITASFSSEPVIALIEDNEIPKVSLSSFDESSIFESAPFCGTSWTLSSLPNASPAEFVLAEDGDITVSSPDAVGDMTYGYFASDVFSPSLPQDEPLPIMFSSSSVTTLSFDTPLNGFYLYAQSLGGLVNTANGDVTFSFSFYRVEWFYRCISSGCIYA